MTSTLTSKGQVTLPKKFRDYLGLQPGASVGFSLGPHGEVIVSPVDVKPRRGKRRFDALRGSLDTGKSTDALMSLLRGYDADAHDPGLK
ncbi:MAG: AbrB/MazE/SpoVT family DNA-binding domain-containing protein [Rhodanobacter thiooxydans]|nr:AbrB/MazE/SpoVT family DNA-binding domain-containing protein [Rhodanobacter thiooxydans]